MERLLAAHERLGLSPWRSELETLVGKRRQYLDTTKGNFFTFKKAVESLPDISPSRRVLDARSVVIGRDSDLTPGQAEQMAAGLEQLRPWRKGPFEFFGIAVDSEWQSWMKWDRIKDVIGDLGGLRILDIGSSNGYYMFRAAAQNPRMVLGVEPQSSFYNQYLAVQKFLDLDNVFCLPVPHHDLPEMTACFDRVLCMGVLYHRDSPVQMLKAIARSMAPGGMLILENLVLDKKEGLCLFPRDRYAKMRNVFFIPDLAAMESWLLRAGFQEISCVDVTPTLFEEQRKTKWIRTESLEDFLDPGNPSKTVEGYPAPVRAVFTARMPGR